MGLKLPLGFGPLTEPPSSSFVLGFMNRHRYNPAPLGGSYLIVISPTRIPLHYEKLRREDIQPLIDKTMKGIAGWRGKLLSYKGRLVLIQTCLASIPVYLLSFFKFPKWAIYMINSQMANCPWNDFEGHIKLHLASRKKVCPKNDFGGLGIPNLQEVNTC